MYCNECGNFIAQGQVGHFAGGFSGAPLCRQCSNKERGIVNPPKTVPIDLIAGMSIGHLPDGLINDLLDYGPCGGIWGELLAPADQWHMWEVRRYAGTYILSYFSQSGNPERPRSYWRNQGIQTASLGSVLTYRPIPRDAWCWYPWKNVYEEEA